MPHVLKGIVKGLRPVIGTYTEGDRKGQEWFFLSLEIHDTKWGETYSCQLPADDPQYKEFVKLSGQKDDQGRELRELVEGKDLKGHEVKVSIKRQTAGERNVKQRILKVNGDKNISMEGQAVLTVRSQITNIQDLGFPKDDDI
jgi:hypothetical protein